MKTANIRFSGTTTVLLDLTAVGDEYDVRLPSTRVTMPVFEITRESKADRRFLRREAAER